MPNITKIPSNSKRSVLLKHLSWNHREKYWKTSDHRRKWAKFNDDQLNGGGKFKIKDGFDVDIPIMEMFRSQHLCEYNENITSKLLKRIESCDIVVLSLANQKITYDEYLKLTSTKRIQSLYLDFADIRYDDGTIVPLDRILAETPKLQTIIIQGDYCDESKFNSMTAKKLVELPRFQKLRSFQLKDISASFNVDDFCNFIMKHKSQQVDYYLHLRFPIDENYKRGFHAAMNKIIKEWNEKHRILIMINGFEYPFEC